MFASITGTQERDACLALTFLLLLIWFFCRMTGLVYAAMAVLLLGMIWPASMRPFAFFWFGLSKVMGGAMSGVLLGVVWAVLVLPVGLVRRAMGRDALGLRKWRNGADTCFEIRDHAYTAADLKNPY